MSWQIHNIFDSSFDVHQRWNQSQDHIRPVFLFVKDQMYRQTYDIFDTHLTRVKVWVKAMII